MCRSGKASMKNSVKHLSTYILLLLSPLLFFYSMLHRISNVINLANVAVITTKKKKYAEQMVKNMITHVRQGVQEW